MKKWLKMLFWVALLGGSLLLLCGEDIQEDVQRDARACRIDPGE